MVVTLQSCYNCSKNNQSSTLATCTVSSEMQGKLRNWLTTSNVMFHCPVLSDEFSHGASTAAPEKGAKYPAKGCLTHTSWHGQDMLKLELKRFVCATTAHTTSCQTSHQEVVGKRRSFQIQACQGASYCLRYVTGICRNKIL